MNRIILLLLSGFFAISVFSQGNTTLVNKGILYVGGGSSSDSKPALYINGDYKAINNSLIYQRGKTVLTGDFLNDVTSGHTFDLAATGHFEFRGSKPQQVSNVSTPKENYIDFPNLIINNRTNVVNELVDSAAVILTPNVGVTTKNIIVERGRLVLETELVEAAKSKMAHLLVNGTTSYPADNRNKSKHERGLIQVKLAIGNNTTAGALFGFTPPFKKIYSDYFFYNFLTRPTNKGLFGDNGQLITSPKVALEGGKGYLIGRDIVEKNHELYGTLWDEQWADAKYDDRITSMMAFGRDFAPSSFSQYATSADAFTGEMLNTEDVSVKLEKGWNFLGNPFTVPMNMISFFDKTSTQDMWGVSRGDDKTYDVENKFYVLSQGVGTYNKDDVYCPFNYSVTYLLAQKQGNTVEIDGEASLLAPMQLFVIKKVGSADATIKIPKQLRTHGEASFKTRSATPYIVDNELLIETKDTKSGSFDRMCVVFRDDASLKATDEYDAEKIINGSGRINQIYSRSSDGKNLVTTVVPFTTDKLTLYFKPATEKQDIELNAYRLKSLSGIGAVKLEDTKTGQTTDLLKQPTYKFTSSPTDKSDRFVLRFNSTVGIPGEQQEEFEVYYTDGTLHLQKLQEIDMNSSINLYDVSGIQLLQEKVTNVPSEELNVPLSKGTYILKLSGKRNEVRKILVK